jgi:uncharacterized protein YjbI with pentapeptide repeats
MTNPTTKKSQRVRFEEVTPTNEIVAYFNAQLPALVADTGLPIFPGYDDLDDIQFVYITLPSGNTVVLGQYEDAPEIGVDLYVELEREARHQGDRKHNPTAIFNIPALVVETLRYLAIPRATAVWFHPDYETEIERLYSQAGAFESIPKIPTEELTLSTEYEPIDCFYYALEIYTREKLPEYWAMLQHNLGLAYFDRIKGERWDNLKKSIQCYKNSLEVFTQDKFPAKWQINQEDLSQSEEALKVKAKNLIKDIDDRNNLIKDILDRPMMSRCLKGVNLNRADLRFANLNSADLSGANLSGANLNSADLSGANLSGANLNSANLSGANLSGANLNRANLLFADLNGANLNGVYLIYADLSGTNLSGTNVENAQFVYNKGISELMRRDLIDRGAIFEDAPGDRSESKTLVPR